MKAAGKNILVLSGGVGGAKLVKGFYENLSAQDHLYVLINTADDFEYLNLAISPDIDTVLYTLAGLNDSQKGWGLQNETWHCHQQLQKLGMQAWFQLGDKDIATHLYRTQKLSEGLSLSQVVNQLSKRFKLKDNVTLLPMSDDKVRSKVYIKGQQEPLAFQEYFVKEACQPVMQRIDYGGAQQAQANVELMQLFKRDVLDYVVIAPSNPVLSIAPIVAINEIAQAMKTLKGKIPILAVSPLVNGRAIKGPTAKIFKELDIACDNNGVLSFYEEYINAFIYDISESVAPVHENKLIQCFSCNTLMNNDDDKIALAKDCVRILYTMNGHFNQAMQK